MLRRVVTHHVHRCCFSWHADVRARSQNSPKEKHASMFPRHQQQTLEERNARRYAVLTVALLGAAMWSLACTDVVAESPQDILRSCDAVIRAAGTAKGAELDIPAAGTPCWYYMSAVQNMSALVNEKGKRLLGICPPNDSTLLDFVRIFARYGHKVKRDENVAALAIVGLAQAFPCGSTKVRG
jgi:hypothetical protein